ncbi:hypothetical protein [Corynebacterium suicordis]|uniref:Phage protein n=1 Tax=Corynebacterium suicordis DSM 45110 TaxID=1121369 RepID=A0ABR9ZLU2_9CORY|nr:hypothetical protein [Corynebacterium suicordis]MBF4554365.1 hypothetical protein [Corynebacterium suicordis DSM 45110]MDR6278611.1 hypothetical protein [Corynebacterium suicordis]
MSEQTQQALEHANEAVVRAEAHLTQSKREALSIIADKIPAVVDQRAKEIAHKHPDVTRNLGKDGVENFRKDLAERAEKLATQIRNGEDNIEWPDEKLLAQSRFWGVSSLEIQNALVNYIQGSPIDQVEAVFVRYGYKGQIPSYRAGIPLLSPQSLCAVEDLKTVAEALEQLGTAQSAQAQAKAEDNQSTVDDLWG